MVRAVRRCMLGREGRGRGAAVRRHAGRRSHGAGYQQRGGVVEERLEEARHFLQLLTDGGHLAGQDVHLERRGGRMEESEILAYLVVTQVTALRYGSLNPFSHRNYVHVLRPLNSLLKVFYYLKI